MGQDSKLELMQQRTAEYLALHEQNPREYPLNVRVVARFVPVSHRLFYKPNPEYRALLNLIEGAREAPNADAAADRHGPMSIPDSALEDEMRRVIARATRAMQFFVTDRREDEDAVDAAYAAYQLDRTVKSLLAAQADLRTLVAEWQRRQGVARQKAPSTPDLFDDAV